MQLPINAEMPEAWKDAWQMLPQRDGVEKLGTLLEAAGHLGVGVFASGPLHEGDLLRNSNIQVGVKVQCTPAV